MTRAVVLLGLLAPAEALALEIGVLRSDDPISEPLLLAMQLEFPEADVVALDADVPAGADVVATIAVTRRGDGFLVRVVERGAPIAVEREIPAEGGDEAAAQAVALLARSLLGVALLYEPERTAASPPLSAIAKAPATRASKALVPRPPPAELEGPHAWVFGAGLAASFGLSPAPTQRFGAAVTVLGRVKPFEIGAQALLLLPADVERPGAHLVQSGIPITLRAGYVVVASDFEVGAGVGVSLERTDVSAELEGESDRSFTDWNLSAVLDARARYRFAPSFAIALGLGLSAPLRRQDYRWRDEVILSVGATLATTLSLEYHY